MRRRAGSGAVALSTATRIRKTPIITAHRAARSGRVPAMRSLGRRGGRRRAGPLLTRGARGDLPADDDGAARCGGATVGA